MSPVSRFLFGVLALAGVGLSAVAETGEVRPYFALLACVLSLAFMVVYAFRPWRAIFAGRAAMVFTSAVFLFSLNATAILWWPGGEGYPGYEDGTELVYVYLALAAFYKLLALIEAKKSDPTV